MSGSYTLLFSASEYPFFLFNKSSVPSFLSVFHNSNYYWWSVLFLFQFPNVSSGWLACGVCMCVSVSVWIIMMIMAMKNGNAAVFSFCSVLKMVMIMMIIISNIPFVVIIQYNPLKMKKIPIPKNLW